MKKRIFTALALTGIIAVSSSIPSTMTAQCATKEIVKMEKIGVLPWINNQGTDIAYEVTDSGVKYRGSSYTKSYTDGEYTYFSVGFTCTSGGCKAQINRVYELDGKIHVDASVKGPEPGQMATCVMTYPYVTGKIAKTDKPIVFDGVVSGNIGGSYM